MTADNSQSFSGAMRPNRNTKRMRGVPLDFNQVKENRISAALTLTGRESLDRFIQTYQLGSINHGVEILSRIVIKLPSETVEALIDAEYSENDAD